MVAGAVATDRMQKRASTWGAVWRLALLTGMALTMTLLTLRAEAAPAAGHSERGRVLFETCRGCHAIEGYRNAYPNYPVPKIAGQQTAYIVDALQAYRAGQRAHATMQAQASSLSDQAMRDIAAYLADQGHTP